MTDVPSPWQRVVKSSDHLTSGPAGVPDAVSCTGCSSGQLEKDRNGARADTATSPQAAH